MVMFKSLTVKVIEFKDFNKNSKTNTSNIVCCGVGCIIKSTKCTFYIPVMNNYSDFIVQFPKGFHEFSWLLNQTISYGPRLNVCMLFNMYDCIQDYLSIKIDCNYEQIWYHFPETYEGHPPRVINLIGKLDRDNTKNDTKIKTFKRKKYCLRVRKSRKKNHWFNDEYQEANLQETRKTMLQDPTKDNTKNYSRLRNTANKIVRLHKRMVENRK
ncbi:hypothetical protein AGLY_003103 [Aphis glycines]|uniref:Uncharacterized protein n=1 Tax=Aphis glycines TaxID=307491 RepID=A0A6G0U4I3_APHGL|nr:hypothetical protein AGLY_003103 [Aphis glycines]